MVQPDWKEPVILSAGRRVIVVLGLLALISAGAYWWLADTEGDEDTSLLDTVTRGSLEIIAASSGTVEAEIRVDVKSRASGEVVEVTVQPGDTAAAGELLVRLDPTDEERRVREAKASAVSVRSRLAQAEAQQASTRADFLDFKGRFNRRKGALEAGLISLEELEAAQTAFEVAEQGMVQREAEIRAVLSDLERAELAISEAVRRLDETIIRAPVSGTVLAVDVERGSIVSSGITNVGGGSTLLTLADLSKLYVVVKLDEANIGRVSPGQDVRIRVDAYPNRTFRGEVERITPVGIAEANIVTFDVKAAITDAAAVSGLLFPGMRTDIEIITSRHENVLLIPSAAIRRNAPSDHEVSANEGSSRGAVRQTGAMGRLRSPRQDATLEGDTAAEESMPERSKKRPHYVILASGEERPVRIGATDGLKTIVLDGLTEGDEVVVAGTSESGGGSSARRSMGVMRRARR